MTKYSIRNVDDHPCAVADPNGCFYSTGEVDKKIEEQKERIFARDKDKHELKQALLEITDPGVDEKEALITDMVNWFRWFQPYPTICVKEYIERGEKFAVQCHVKTTGV